MIKRLIAIAALVLITELLQAGPVITDIKVNKHNGNVTVTMTSDVPFQLVATSDFVTYVVVKEYKAKNHVVYIDKKRQKNDPYRFYIVRPTPQ